MDRQLFMFVQIHCIMSYTARKYCQYG